jgi:hypothetical protein
MIYRMQVMGTEGVLARRSNSVRYLHVFAKISCLRAEGLYEFA